ncbi:hypothetical protein AFLA_011918 [Aspergillus flavus NRRL3357]|nr:hypothetical protein AFLA_011918 [Aspergillus flavus NRRL3357]
MPTGSNLYSLEKSDILEFSHQQANHIYSLSMDNNCLVSYSSHMLLISRGNISAWQPQWELGIHFPIGNSAASGPEQRFPVFIMSQTFRDASFVQCPEEGIKPYHSSTARTPTPHDQNGKCQQKINALTA